MVTSAKSPPSGIGTFELSALAATRDLLAWCRQQGWAGHDPYDGLCSRLFQATPLRHYRWPRLILIQSFKRSPFNFRRLLRVPKDQNPKGIALFLSSAVRLQESGLSTSEEVLSLADRLIALRSAGWERMCWGYNFDWQTRTYLVPRFYPNIICTTFAAEALLDAYDRFGNEQWLKAAIDSAHFILEKLPRAQLDDTICFGYTPIEVTRVHNASLLGAALLARLHKVTGHPEFASAALAATRYGLRHQCQDGSWIYGEGAKQGWIDSFHTGYNLLALHAVSRYLSSEEADRGLRLGFDYYRKHFFAPDGVVKYYHDETFPIDTHAVAHAILTLMSLDHLDSTNHSLASEVIDWSLRQMRHPEGFFYYQRWRTYTNRIPYMRWTQAWMLIGLSTYVQRRGLKAGSTSL